MSNSEFRQKENEMQAEAGAEAGSDEEVFHKEDPPIKTVRPKLKKTKAQAEAEKAASLKQAPARSTRTRKRGGAAKATGKEDTSGYETNSTPSPASKKELSKEFKDSTKRKLSSNASDWSADETAAVGTEDWRTGGSGSNAVKNSGKKLLRGPAYGERLPYHGTVDEIIADPEAVKGRRGSVTIREYEWDEIVGRLKEVRKETDIPMLADALSGLTETLPEDRRQQFENLLVTVRSREQSQSAHAEKQDEVIEKLAEFVSQMGEACVAQKEELASCKSKLRIATTRYAGMKKKLTGEVETLQQDIKRKASMSTILEIREDASTLRDEVEHLGESWSQGKESLASDTKEVAKVVRDHKVEQDKIRDQLQHLQKNRQPESEEPGDEEDDRDWHTMEDALGENWNAEDPAPDQEQPPPRENRRPARPAAATGPAGQQAPSVVNPGPVPQPNLQVQQGVVTHRARLAKSKPIPKTGKSVPRIVPMMQNPGEMMARARELKAKVGDKKLMFLHPTRGYILQHEYTRLPIRERVKVRCQEWTVQPNNPEQGTGLNKADSGCFRCGGPHPRRNCPKITCNYCGQPGHKMDHCIHNHAATFSNKRADKPHLYPAQPAPQPATYGMFEDADPADNGWGEEGETF